MNYERWKINNYFRKPSIEGIGFYNKYFRVEKDFGSGSQSALLSLLPLMILYFYSFWQEYPHYFFMINILFLPFGPLTSNFCCCCHFQIRTQGYAFIEMIRYSYNKQTKLIHFAHLIRYYWLWIFPFVLHRLEIYFDRI